MFIYCLTSVPLLSEGTVNPFPKCHRKYCLKLRKLWAHFNYQHFSWTICSLALKDFFLNFDWLFCMNGLIRNKDFGICYKIIHYSSLISCETAETFWVPKWAHLTSTLPNTKCVLCSKNENYKIKSDRAKKTSWWGILSSWKTNQRASIFNTCFSHTSWPIL